VLAQTLGRDDLITSMDVAPCDLRNIVIRSNAN
jgi:hypothetical protein